MRKLWSVLALCPLLLASAAPKGATGLVLIADRDNTLFEQPDGLLSNGAGEHLFAGATNQRFEFRRRALVAFDLTGIPPGTDPGDVSFSIQMNRTIAGSVIMRLHRVTASWGEEGSDAPGLEGKGDDAETGDATWIHRHFPDVFWTDPGGDFQTAESASVSIGTDGIYTFGPTAEMTADVRDWIDDPSSNHGWILITSELSRTPTAKRFSSRETEQGIPPTLRLPAITSLPTEIPTLSELGYALFAAAVVLLALARLRRKTLRA